jgi:hypothetical protein
MGRKHIIESFVARFWLERGPNGDPKWRGHIRHVQGDEETYFEDLAEVCQFLERVSGISGSRMTAQGNEDAASSEPSAVAIKKRKS